MTACELIEECINLRIELTPKSDRIRVISPAAVPDDIREELRRHKPDLLTPALADYVATLEEYVPEDGKDLPPVPPFRQRPERPLAWSAWWAAVDRGRKERNNGQK